MDLNEYVMAAIGGALIGIAAVLLLWLNGRIAGISGIAFGLFSRRLGDSGWRIAFLAGLILAGLGYQWLGGATLIERHDFPVWMTVAAGLLVGFGTRLGNGCTSGHGICGVSRLSPRSIAATISFVVIGMATATTISKVFS